ncbi:MAG: histidine triad nucleotide-binding protein [bacterium]|nr:histidine triad nucleotide-binding protein [bacterium]
MSDCIFCKIAARSLPVEIVHEEGDVLAFNDIHPKAPVHILVIPKQHIQSIAHLEADHSDVLARILYAAKRIAAERGLEGYKLIFNVGRAGGQAVDHLHLHLLGGWSSAGDRSINV